MRRLRLGFLIAATLILPTLRGDQTFTNSNITATYPTTVQVTTSFPVTFIVTLQLQPGSQDNVAGMTCSGPGSPSVSPQFVSLLAGSPASFNVTVQSFTGSTASEQCDVTTGVRGGDDDPVIDLNPITIQQALSVQPTGTFLFGGYSKFSDQSTAIEAVVHDLILSPPGNQLDGTLTAAIQNSPCELASPDNLSILAANIAITSGSLVIACPSVGPDGATGTVTVSGMTTDGTKASPFTITQNFTLTGPGTNPASTSLEMFEPVSTATGELFAPAVPTFLSLGGPLPLEFRRYYASLLNNNQVATHTNNWTHNFESFVSVLGPFAVVSLYDGKRISFLQSGTAYKAMFPEQYDFQLVSATGSLQFLDPRTNLIYTFAGTNTGTGIKTWA